MYVLKSSIRRPGFKVSRCSVQESCTYNPRSYLMFSSDHCDVLYTTTDTGVRTPHASYEYSAGHSCPRNLMIRSMYVENLCFDAICHVSRTTPLLMMLSSTVG